MMKEIHPEQFLKWYEVSRRAERQEDGIVLDVREEWEWEYYRLEHSLLMPMRTIPTGAERLPRDRPIYVLCAHGIRSAAVCDYLERRGWDNAVNVIGGMAQVAALRGFQYD